MAKRGATSELNDRNWDDEEETEEAGTFTQASKSVMESRVVKRAKRRGNQDEGGGGTKSVFGGFAGLASKPTLGKSATAPAPTSGFTFGLGDGTGSTLGGASKTSFGAASSLNGVEDKKSKSRDDAGDSSSYFRALKTLNQSVLAWIKQHVEEDPYIFLTPIFKDYQTHLDAIGAKKQSTFSSTADSKSSPKESSDILGSGKSVLSVPPSSSTKSDTMEADKDQADGATSNAKSSLFGASTSQAETKVTTPFGGVSSSNGTSGSFKFSTSNPSTTGFSFGGQKTEGATKSLFTFGTTSTDSSTNKPGSGFSFGLPKGGSEGGTSGFSFGTAGGLGSQGAKSSLFGAGNGATTTTESSNKDEEEYVPPKPEVKEIKEDDALYTIRCKLYFQRDGQWVDRGLGNLHLKPVAENKTQLLVRADTNLGNILLNIMLSTSIPMSRQGKNNVFLACIPNPPLSNKPADQNSTTPVPMLIRVKTAEAADELKSKVDERLKLLS